MQCRLFSANYSEQLSLLLFLVITFGRMAHRSLIHNFPRLLLTSACLLWLCANLSAQSANPKNPGTQGFEQSSNPVVEQVSENIPHYTVETDEAVQLFFPSLLKDVARSARIDAILEQESLFRLSTAMSLSATPNAVWLVFDVQNKSGKPLALWFDDTGLDTLQTFCVVRDAAGKKTIVLHEYAGLTFASHPIAGLPLNMLYATGADTLPKRVFVRLASREPMAISVYSGSDDALRRYYEGRFLLNAVIVGLILALIAYNVLLSLMLRSVTYMLYVVYGLSALLYILYATGLIVPFCGKAVTEFVLGKSFQIGLLVMFFTVAFATRFLHVAERLPAWLLPGRAVLVIIVLSGFVRSIVPMTETAYTVIIAVVATITSVFCISMSIVAGLRGNKAAWLYLLAWILLLTMFVILIPAIEGYIPLTPLLLLLPQVGFTVELLLMSFALAYRIRILQQERQSALLENERLVQEQNRILEQKVHERTMALEDANLQLAAANEEIQRQLEVQTEQAHHIELSNTELQETSDNLALVNHELLELNEQLSGQKEELQAKNQALADAEQFRLNMLSIVSHDLKNPISAITGLASVLLDNQGFDERTKEMLYYIADSGERMSALVRDLLDTAARSSTHIALVLAPTELKDITAGVLAHHIHASERKRQRLIFTSHEEVWVNGDVKRLFQVFDNLVSNAVKYSPEGGTIWVSVSKILTQTEKKALWSVRDEGAGFTEEDKTKAFGFFQKLSAEPTGGESSSGVGLAIARQIVDLHGGTIRIESKAGQGATMIVELPLLQDW
jgi:signal transduction histidine kinase